jgi:hypothetical protein
MTIKKISQCIALVLCPALAHPAAAAPRLIGSADVKATKTAYSLFYADPKKVLLSAQDLQTTLQARLDAAGEGRTACFIAGDLAVNNMTCGNGAIRFGADYFSFNSLTNMPLPLITFTDADKRSGLDKVTGEFAVNARPTLVGQATETTRVIQIRFNQRMAQFGMIFDPFIVTTSPDLTEGRVSDGVQFIVNGQATPVRDFSQELRGNLPFVGVEDPHGFTEVTVISSGGGSIIGDMYTIVPLAKF